MFGLSELSGCNSFNWTILTKYFKLTWPHGSCVLRFWFSAAREMPTAQNKATTLAFFLFFLMPGLVSNQAISSIDGSVSLASCLFVSADKGTAICGRWTLLTLAIPWLFVWHWHQCDHRVRKINCQLAPTFLMLTGFPILFFFSLLSYFFFLHHHHLSTSHFKSDPNLNYRDASAWYGYQMLTLHYNSH